MSGDNRGDTAADTQVRHPFPVGERVGNPDNLARPVLDADQDRPAGSVRECDHRAQQPLRRGQIALELEDLALGAAEDFGAVHRAGSSLGSGMRPCGFGVRFRAADLARTVDNGPCG